MSWLLLDSCYYHSVVIDIGGNLLYIHAHVLLQVLINQNSLFVILLLLFLMVTVINYIVCSDMLLLFLLIMRVINYIVCITLLLLFLLIMRVINYMVRITLLLLLLLLMLMMSMGPNFILNEFGRLVPSVG